MVCDAMRHKRQRRENCFALSRAKREITAYRLQIMVPRSKGGCVNGLQRSGECGGRGIGISSHDAVEAGLVASNRGGLGHL